MEKTLQGQVAIVTGAAAGIGKAIAARFLAEGAKVMLVGYRQSTLEPTVRALSDAHEGRAAMFVADVAQAAKLAPAIMDFTLAKFGAPDILVNNAGIYPSQPSLEISEEDWERVYDLNVKGTFFMAQAAARMMVAQQKAGRIVNITSTAGEVARPGVAHYCSSKAAVKMMTQVLALEWAKYGIRVNAFGPGLVETEALLHSLDTEEARREHREKVTMCPLGRTGLPEEIAEGVLFFASGRSAFVTGQTLLADGGYAAGRVYKSKL